MPSISESQHNLMEAAAHGAKFPKAKKIPKKVAQEFVAADTGKSFKNIKKPKSALADNYKHMNNGGKSITSEDVSRGFSRKKI